MSEVNQTKVKRQKKRLSKSALVLIIGILIIAIPIAIFLAILGISALQTGSPRLGSRFNNDLNPEISNSQVEALASELKAMSSVEEVEVILAQGQLRIFVDTDDNMSDEQFDSLLTSVYSKVNSSLPIDTYFTATDTEKMYDLAINVYTKAKASDLDADSSRKYKLLHKNSKEDTYQIDDLAHPKNPELAAQLQGNNEIETEEEIEGSEESNNN